MDYDFSSFDLDAFQAQQRESKDADRATRRADRTNPLAIGRWVTVRGLQSKPELNGLTGEVIQKEPSPGRIGVLVHLDSGSTKEFALKSQNLCTFPDDQTVGAVRLGAAVEGGPLHVVETRVPKQLLPDVTACPVPHAVGVPLLVAKARPYKTLRERADYDNQWATWLMIDPNSGFAPDAWQSFIGPVWVYREDDRVFNWDDMLIMSDYLLHLLDLFGDGEVTPDDITARAFQDVKERKLEEQRMNPDQLEQTLDLNI